MGGVFRFYSLPVESTEGSRLSVFEYGWLKQCKIRAYERDNYPATLALS